MQVNSTQDCDCNISSMPSDDGASLPAHQKELLEKADIKYIATETNYNLSLFFVGNSRNLFYQAAYTLTVTDNIFHPPLS